MGLKTFLILGLLICYKWSYAASERPSLARPFLDAPVYVGSTPVGQMWLFPRTDKEEFMVHAEPLIELLKNYLEPGVLKGLQDRVRAEDVLSLEDLERFGISVRFDEKTLELYLDIPLKYRQPRALDITGRQKDSTGALRPHAQSGYLNFRGVQTYTYGNVQNRTEPLSGNLEFVENINGYVFESGFDFVEGEDQVWRRQDTRLRYDDETGMNRWTLGDLTLRSTGFQRAPNMAGLSVVKEFSIQPYRTIRPLSRSEVMIKRPSLVEVYVNGFLLSQIRLAPGVFNIRDYPLVNGLTAVKIRVIDDLGQEETYDFSILFENTLLNQGESEFSYSVGAPWAEVDRDRDYDDKHWLTSLYHRYGFSHDLTLGANFQNFNDQSLFGAEASTMMSLGYLSLEVAQSQSTREGAGTAQKLRYRSLDSSGGKVNPFVFWTEYEHRTSAFYPVNQTNQFVFTDYSDRVDLQLNYRYYNRIYFNVGGEYQFRPAFADRKLYRANLTLPLTARARVELAISRVEAESSEDRGMLSFYWSDREGIYSASAYSDSYRHSQNVTVNRNNRQLYDDFRGYATLASSEDGDRAQVMGEYLWQPLSARLDHYSHIKDGNNVNSTSLGINTGIAWVGAQWAFTQSVNDSFILLHSENLPENTELLINPNGDYASAKLIGKKRSTTILKDQTSYYQSTLSVDPTYLPQGYLLGAEFYQTLPTYRSGILVDLSVVHKIAVKGRLVQGNNQAMAYLAGDVFNERGELVDNTFFTSSNGVFVIEGLEPGTYTIRTSQRNLKGFRFVVPQQVDGSLNLGNIRMDGGSK